ncbi:Six-hairpin glycosidase-like protein [Cladochytrium replicatum]|nr:Six-hairpin glycosidase-like protein [Cladochytrium replicatum]
MIIKKGPLSVLALVCVSAGAVNANAPDGGTQYGSEDQFAPTYTTLISQSYRWLQRLANKGTSDAGAPYYFTQPSLFKYGAGQWLWDSCGAIVANVHRNPEDAKSEFRTLMNSQIANGMVPEEISWPSGSGNQVTQMPTIAHALQTIYRETKDAAFIKEMVPKVAAYYEWWRTTRDIDGNGLVTTIHPWESGIDASPAFDAAWHFTYTTPIFSFPILYLKFPELQSYYKDTMKWNITAILARKKAEGSIIANWFMVQDIAMNTLHAVGWAVLGDLATAYGDTANAKVYYANNVAAENAIKKEMWRSDLKRFVTCFRDQDGSRQQSAVQTVQSLFPLLMRSLTAEQKAAVIADASDPTKFWSNYPFPSVSKAEKTYEAVYTVNLLWRGPSWGFTNWFVVEGLINQGRQDLAQTAVDRWAKAIAVGGIWEMFNADTGYGYGAEGLGMSTTIVDSLHRTGLVTLNNDFSGLTLSDDAKLWLPDVQGSASGGSAFDESFWVKALGTNAVIDRIDLRGADRVDQIALLYGDRRAAVGDTKASYYQTHGGTGGNVVTLSVPRNASIVRLDSCIGSKGGGRRVFYVKFTLSTGSFAEVGKTTDTCYVYVPPSGQRIVGIFGRAGDELDAISAVGFA